MNRDNFEWKAEDEWLQEVLEEAGKQYDNNNNLKEKIREDAIRTQKELWEEVGSVSIANGMDQITDFMQFINFMRTQKISHESTRKIQEKYEKVLSSPYFGRIDFIEDVENEAEKYYIGLSNLINDNFDFLVYDWRAPISSMFYDCEIGEASYKCPEGVMEGELILKRQYKINNGKMEYMFDSNLKIDDEMLQDILSKSTDDRMKAIVTTIQREQNRVIRDEEYKVLIVQGPAGSGKTSIALHRIAYLLYRYRDKITPRNIVIFSPNEIFNDYISNVLPELGEDNMYQTTFKEYMHMALGGEFIKESYCDMMEYILNSKNELNYKNRITNIMYKSTVEFVNILKYYVTYVEKIDRKFTDIIFRDMLVVSSKDLEELFFKDYIRLPLKRRLKKIKERILFLLDPYKKDRIKKVVGELEDTGSYINKMEILKDSISIVNNEMKEIYNEIDRITEFNLAEIYKGFFENLEFFCRNLNIPYCKEKIEKIRNYTIKNLETQKLNYEDQIPLLYLKAALGDIPKTSDIKYVIIDEAQDYTPLQYEIFCQLFESANMTILGDLNQSINPFMNIGGYNNISYIFSESNTCIINLTKSYRSTKEITEFSRKLLNSKFVDESIQRNGNRPLLIGFSKEEEIKEKILNDIKIYKERGYKSIGIITRTAKEANDVYDFLKDKIHIKAIMKDDDDYVNDTLVIPAYLAKGLEFDVVLIYNVGNGNYCCEDERLLLYTACTRALHILCIYYSGKCTPLLN
ncbi:RNA polymerase recycling motor HelD [Tissierella sp. MB52-C2]|uniref:RNA polymerase recycling motor HelD n=1 Tax=Tissierella sp. MB52-C2 TaxID=3070999 RepID=UPI00280A8D36|nr:RNA polymerase recycling motor HelD [Tissierella sp. MB52-C2]WMM24774.1 RNA polymerase recycling motor HelD [Tissierella sp. MB52-C2]